MIGWLLAPRRIAYGLAGAALLGAATWAWVTVRGWRHDSERLPAVVAERDAAVATVALAKQEASRNAAIVIDLRNKNDALRADLRERPIVVRVCAEPAKAVLPARTAPRTDAGAAGPEPREAAPDTGREVDLSPYAEDAAAVADQLRALQRWVNERP